jgi:hypothetical protein
MMVLIYRFIIKKRIYISCHFNFAAKVQFIFRNFAENSASILRKIFSINLFARIGLSEISHSSLRARNVENDGEMTGKTIRRLLPDAGKS